MRWIQRVDKKTGKTHMEPVDEAARNLEPSHSIHANNFDTFKSPIDGELVRNVREYKDHLRKHNVVNAKEFSPEYYATKQKERDMVLSGERTKDEVRRDRQDIYDKWTQAERNG